MNPSILALCAVALASSLAGLLLVGARWMQARFYLAAAYGLLVVIPAYVMGDVVWRLPRVHLWVGCAVAYVAILAAALIKRDWNPPAQAFFGLLAATVSSFLVMAVSYAFTRGSSPPLLVADLGLLALELFAFTLLMFSTHEALDTVGRVHWRRRTQGTNRNGWTPFVSVHVAAHNEPPELVIETLSSLTKLDYPAYEVIVLDNNTVDEALWRPVEVFCNETGGVLRFVHLENWPGFKSGALNHGLDICDPRTEIVAVVDADFIVSPDFLDRTVGYFADQQVAIVQTAQGFRSEVETDFFRRLALTYKTFDAVTMPSRNERNAIIFAGTMGLIRHSVLEEVGRWGEWCVTEDAELSLRVLGRGYKAIFVERIFGRGVMPLTFAAMKSQRFRWCFGGVQILRRHRRLLFTRRSSEPDGTKLSITPGQQFDYLFAALQWFTAPMTIAFAVLLLAGLALRLLGVEVALRPMVGFFIAMPALLLITGMIRGLWGLQSRLEASLRDVLGVFAIFISMTWAVALGCFQGLTRKEGAFLRTPKFKENESFKQALKTTKVETPFALLLTAGAVMAATSGGGFEAAFLSALCAWGAFVFWSAPVTALVASRTELRTAALRRRRALESIRQRIPLHRRPASYALVGSFALLAFAMFAGSVTVAPTPGEPGDLFALPERIEDPDDEAPKRRPLADINVHSPSPSGSAGRTRELVGSGDSRSGTGSQARTTSSRTGTAQTNPGSSSAPAPQESAAPAPQETAAPAPQATVAPAPASQPSPAPQSTPAARPTSEPSPAPQASSSPAARPTARP